jgi:hypothetical protein
MLQKFGDNQKRAPAALAEDTSNSANDGEASLHGAEAIRSIRELREESEEDDWEVCSESGTRSEIESPSEGTSDASPSEDDSDGRDLEWHGRDRF